MSNDKNDKTEGYIKARIGYIKLERQCVFWRVYCLCCARSWWAGDKKLAIQGLKKHLEDEHRMQISYMDFNQLIEEDFF